MDKDQIVAQLARKHSEQAKILAEITALEVAAKTPADQLHAVIRSLLALADQSDKAYEEAEERLVVGDLRKSQGKNGPDSGSSGSDLSRKNILEAALQILKERGGGPLFYAVIANEAWDRGYKGRKGSDKQKIQRSFYQTLQRESHDGKTIEKAGSGEFRLKARPPEITIGSNQQGSK